MTMVEPFAPGQPLTPYYGYGRRPRQFNYQVATNVTTETRQDRIPFQTLEQLWSSYDIARTCTNYSINDMRSMRVRYEAMDDYEENPTKEIAEAKRRLRRPDGRYRLADWIAINQRNLWVLDAAPIYRMRDRAGRVKALHNISGRTIAPMLDYYGGWPEDPAPAFQQFIEGVPWDWLTQRDIIYWPFWPQSDSPYGTPPLENILVNANTDIRLQLYFLQFFCYEIAGTEVLTRDGWRKFSELDGSEEFATRSPKGKFEWQHTVDGEIHRFDYDGDLIRFQNQCVDQLVTPNHRMLTRRIRDPRVQEHNPNHDWHIRRADFFVGNPTAEFQLPILSEWEGSDPGEETVFTAEAAGPRGRVREVRMPTWAWARLLGIFVAEGSLRESRYEISIAQMAGGDLEEVERILKDTGLHYRYECGCRFVISSKALCQKFAECGHGAANKRLPAEVMDWTPELIGHVLHGLQVGDGHTTPSGQRVYTTTSSLLADQVQELWQKVGVYASVNRYDPDARTFAKLVQYKVRTRPEEAFRVPKPTLEPYKGEVACVSVPNGIIMVRRNGKAMWCGNTAGSVPEAFAIAPEDMTSGDDIADFEEQYYDYFHGDQSERWGLHWLPNGTELQFYKPQMFDPDLAEYVERRTIAAYGLTPQNLGILADVNRACYSDDTETLTESGWKRYDAVLPDEKIATFNPDTKALEFHVPERLYTYSYEGEMIHFSSRQVDCCVTPDHKMWVGRRSEVTSSEIVPDRPVWYKAEARELESLGDFWFTDSAMWEGGEEFDQFVLPGIEGLGYGQHTGTYSDRVFGMDPWLEFLGWIVSEGCIFGDGTDGRYKVSLSQSLRVNPEKVRVIDACLAKLPFAFRSYDSECDDARRWQVSDKALWTWLRENIGHYSGDKRLPNFWRLLGKRQLSILFEELILGDGHVDPNPNATNQQYFTKSKQLADDVQELALRLGLRAQVRWSAGARVHVVGISEPGVLGNELRWSKNVTREQYKGTVWCFDVPPHHLFLTRRNGKVAIQGNSSDTQTDQQFRISTLPIVQYYEDLFDMILQEDWDLPVQLRFDTGREKEDRLTESEAMLNYWQMGAISSDEVREKILGYPVDNEEPIPRAVYDPRLGVIPNSHIIAISGKINRRTLSPEAGSVDHIDYVMPGTPGSNPLQDQGQTTPGTEPADAARNDRSKGLAKPRGARPKAQGSDPTKTYPVPLYPPRRSAASKEQLSGETNAALPVLPGGLASDSPQDEEQVGYGKFRQPHGSTGQGTGVSTSARGPVSPDDDELAEYLETSDPKHSTYALKEGAGGGGAGGGGGITAGSGIAGVDHVGGDDDDERNDLVRWQKRSKKDVEKGRAPRHYAGSAIRTHVYDAAWTRLSGATSVNQVTEAFDQAFKSAEPSKPEVAGVALVARDSGRVLLVQRVEGDDD